MKIKNSLALFVSLSISFFNFLYINTKTEVEQYLNQTPAQFSTISIRYYLTNHIQNKKKQFPNSKNFQKSKTSIFNQSLSKYVKEIYNNNNYSNFLSQDGSHIVEFLELSEELNLDIIPLYTCLRLFYNKIKSCELIDDNVALQILNPLPILLKKYFVTKDKKTNNLKFLKKSIEKTILFKFTNHLTEFQKKPNNFISQLSKDISKITQKEIIRYDKEREKSEMQGRLRNLIIKFLEILFDKLIWDIKSYEGIWESVLSISNNIIRLANHNILDHRDDLDDLLWSLTLRFCYFLNLTGANLPVDFYEEIENDISDGTAFFLEIEEEDKDIKTKKEILIDSLIKAKVKAIAFENHGIFSDQLI